jgi:hypothetical protein
VVLVLILVVFLAMEKRLVFGKKNGFGGVIYDRFLGD